MSHTFEVWDTYVLRRRELPCARLLVRTSTAVGKLLFRPYRALSFLFLYRGVTPPAVIFYPFRAACFSLFTTYKFTISAMSKIIATIWCSSARISKVPNLPGCMVLAVSTVKMPRAT